MSHRFSGWRHLIAAGCLVFAISVFAPRAARGQPLHSTLNGNVTGPSGAAGVRLYRRAFWRVDLHLTIETLVQICCVDATSYNPANTNMRIWGFRHGSLTYSAIASADLLIRRVVPPGRYLQ